jgi:hypothetical protein
LFNMTICADNKNMCFCVHLATLLDLDGGEE